MSVFVLVCVGGGGVLLSREIMCVGFSCRWSR